MHGEKEERVQPQKKEWGEKVRQSGKDLEEGARQSAFRMFAAIRHTHMKGEKRRKTDQTVISRFKRRQR
jgi:hypothetical protein